MVVAKAGTCQHPGCTRMTYDPLCWQHVRSNPGRDVPLQELIPDEPPTGVEDHDFDSLARSWSAISRAFPEVSDRVSTESVARQVEETVRSAISVEVYRKFPALDVPDPQMRDQYARYLEDELISSLNVESSKISVSRAEQLLKSSNDRYGRGIDESAELANYGLRCEWELARLLETDRDRNGIPYNLGYDEYVHLVQQRHEDAIRDQLATELSRFDQIIREISDRPPLAPGSPSGARENYRPEMLEDYLSLEVAVDQEAQEYIAATQRARQEERAEAMQDLKAFVKGNVSEWMESKSEKRQRRIHEREERQERQRVLDNHRNTERMAKDIGDLKKEVRRQR